MPEAATRPVSRGVLFATAGFTAAVAGVLAANPFTLVIGGVLFRLGGISQALDWVFLAIVVLVPAGALVGLRLWPHRAWVWSLGAGAVLNVPTLAVPVTPDARAQAGLVDVLVSAASTTAPLLIAIGALAAAAWLSEAGVPGAGAVLAGVVAALPVAGLIVTTGTAKGTLHGVLTVVAVCAAIGAMSLVRALPRDAVERTRPNWRVVLPGCAALALPYAVPLIGVGKAAQESWAAVGLLAVLLCVTAVTGLRTFVGASAVGLVYIATQGPILQTLFIVMAGEVRGWALLAAVAGMAVGLAASTTRHRAQIAVTGLVVVAVGLVVLPTTSGSGANTAFVAESTGQALLVIALLVATTTVQVSTVAIALTQRATGVVAIAALAPGLVVGGTLLATWLNGGRTSAVGGLAPVPFTLSGGLVAVAALLVLWLSRRAEEPAEPALATPHHDGVVGLEDGARDRGEQA